MLATGGQFGGHLRAGADATMTTGEGGGSVLDFAVSGAENQLDGLLVTNAGAGADAGAGDSTKPRNGGDGRGGGRGGDEEGVAGNSTGFVVVGGSNPDVSGHERVGQ